MTKHKAFSIAIAVLLLAPLAARQAAAEDISTDRIEVVRSQNNPIIRPDMLPGHDGGNINGPSLIRAPAWLAHPLGKYTNMGDAPERIFHCHLDLTGDWKSWKTSKPEEVLRPETEWKGARLPVKESANGAAEGAENALRDPAIFVEDGRVYRLYSVAGERGIAIAECKRGAPAAEPPKAQP
jgi:hypothetical protein